MALQPPQPVASSCRSSSRDSAVHSVVLRTALLALLCVLCFGCRPALSQATTGATTGAVGTTTTSGTTTGEVKPPPPLEGQSQTTGIDGATVTGIVVGVCCCVVILCIGCFAVSKQKAAKEREEKAREDLRRATETARRERQEQRKAKKETTIKQHASPDDSWYEMRDPKGRLYYYNSITGETRYPAEQ